MTYDDLKRINIAEFAEARLGFVPDREGDSRLWRKLASPEGIKIWTRTVPKRNGHYLYSSSSFNGGSLIDLLRNLGWSYKQILQLENLAPVSPKPSCSLNRTRSLVRYLGPLALEALFDRLPSVENTPRDNYFYKRGITETIRLKFGLQATPYTTLFKLYRIKEGKLQAVSAIKYRLEPESKKTTKRFLASRGESISLLFPLSFSELKDPRLYIFESPVDALSFYQLYASKLDNNVVLLSTCGNLTHGFLASWVSWLAFFRPKLVGICFDWDREGGKFAEKLKKATPSTHLVKMAKKPKNSLGGKDWNDLVKK